jgi:hypothetical protein
VTAFAEQQLSSVLADVARAVEALEFSKPEFSLDVRWAKDYDELFRHEGSVAAEDSLLESAIRNGRVVLAGRGGSGKTQLLLRIMRHAAQQGIAVFLLRLQEWAPEDYREWELWTKDSLADGASFLVERFSSPSTTLMQLDWLPPNVSKLLIVDGLNEVPARLGANILRAIDELTRKQVGTCSIVADRLVRRELPVPFRWELASVQPLSAEKIASYGGKAVEAVRSRELLDSPFFLDAAIKRDIVQTGVVQTHIEYFDRHAGIRDEELDKAAHAAYVAYARTRSRTFQLSIFDDVGASSIAKRLLDAGVLISTGGVAHFRHHLLHDYLAARHLANVGEELWGTHGLATVSFGGSSFDAIALVLEHLTGDRADLFLRSLYDWNLYSAGYALAESSNAESGPSPEMRTVILSMLAEKLFDPVLATRRRAKDALLLNRLPESARFLDARCLSDVLGATASIEYKSKWFQQWRDAFVDNSGRTLETGDIELICSDDSVLGWTMTNVSKRLRLGKSGPQLRSKVDGASPTVRWRIAHILGAFPSTENQNVLLSLLEGDKDDDVRYGAVRSLAELAWRSKDDGRSEVVDSLLARAALINESTKLREELARALIIDENLAPQGWKSVVLRFAREFFARTEDPMARDHWRMYVADARARYQS